MALAEKYVDTMNVAVPTQKPLVRGDREVTSIPQEKQKADLLRLLAVSGLCSCSFSGYHNCSEHDRG